MKRLSVCLITANEEDRLRASLESVAWADEIVVVDAESTDKTVMIAREFTDRVVIRPWPGFAAQKNFALDQATGDWILSLDADERVTPELRARVEDILRADGPAAGYAVPRRNIFWGRWVRHGRLYPDRQIRLKADLASSVPRWPVMAESCDSSFLRRRRSASGADLVPHAN